MRSKRALALCILAVGLLAAGCGGSDKSGAGGAGGKSAAVTTVKVGTLPTTTAAALFLGVDKGFFRAERLNVQPVLAEGGAAVVPAVLNGSMQFGFSADLSLITAAAQGVPIQIVAPGVAAGATADQDYCAVMSKGAIRAPADLAGKTIAVNTLKNLGEITVKAALQKQGVDVSGIKFVEVQFPDMAAALDAHRVDAIWACEPFLTLTQQSGARAVIGTLVGTQPNMSVSTYFTSTQYAQSHGDVVDRFDRAMRKSLAYAKAHPDVVRQETERYARIPAPVAQKMILPTWPTAIDRNAIALEARLAERYGVIDHVPDLNTLIRQ